MSKKYGFSFSWKRALGISSAKNQLSRAIGIPLTKSGRQRKIGRLGAGFLTAALASAIMDKPTGKGVSTQEKKGCLGWAATLFGICTWSVVGLIVILGIYSARNTSIIEKDATPTPTPTATATPQMRTAQVMPTPLGYNPAKESMAAAVRRYPELSKADSPLNKAFVALFNDAKAKKSPILFQSDWPMRLADLATLSLKEKSR